MQAQRASEVQTEPAAVRALAAGRSRDHRRVLAREWLRDRFWALPSLLLVAGVLLAIVTAEAETLGLPAADRGWLPVRAGAADTILGVIATSMLTFVGVVFTITLVALQLASAQLSPRVLRTFVRSFLTKLAFGIFLATFAFAMTVLVLDQLEGGPARRTRAPSRSPPCSSRRACWSSSAYVTATMKLLQVSWVITAVANETRRAVAVNFPPAEAYLTAAAPALSPSPALLRLSGEGRRALGVLRGIDRARLVELARRPRLRARAAAAARVLRGHRDAGVRRPRRHRRRRPARCWRAWTWAGRAASTRTRPSASASSSTWRRRPCRRR